jgi:hypothetical protein
MRGAAPELAIAAATAAATAAAGYAMAGGGGAAVVAIAAAAASLLIMRTLVPAGTPPDTPPGGGTGGRRTDRTVAPAMTGYWQRRFAVSAGIARPDSYEAGLRRTLEHLLAARLAERHGINLYEDPAAARRLWCDSRRHADLWYWIDPGRAPGPARRRHGIPQRTLARLLDRLEQL